MGNQKNIRNMSNRMLPLSFPPSKSALWDSAPMGDPIGLHFSYYRNPRVLLSEKALRLAYRHAKTERKLFSCFLMSNFYIDEDEEGITLSIDRFDPGREKMGSLAKVPSALLPEDFVIPCSIGTGEGPTNGLVHTPENLTSSFKGLQSHLHSKEALDLSKLLTVRARITYTENMDNLHFDVHWAAVAVANTFESTPIKPVPIIPTALARNLSSHNNIAQLQGTHKCGYLTMDQTRKLLLVLESDPKVYMLPLVGIWVSGVTHIHSPQVWAICLRYMFSSSVNERVLSESGAFLIVLYSLTHKEPEFYECTPCVSHDPLSFQLLTCEDALHLFKDVEVSRNPLKFELTSECQDSEAILFKETCKSKENFLVSAGRPFNSFNSSSRQASSPEKLLKSDHDSGVEDEDFSPRPSPRPHPSVQQVTRIHPSVPELSLVFGSFFDSKTPSHTTEKKNNTPLSSTPHIVNGALEYVSKPVEQQQLYENQSNDSNLKQQNPAKATTIKPYKGKYSPDECQPCPMQVRRNSATTTSIHSTQKLSPDSSMQQIKVSSEQDQTDNRSGQIHCSGPDTLRRSLLSNSWPTTSSNYPNHNVTFPLQTRHVTEGPKPLHQGNIHNCCHSTVKCHSLIPFHAFENPPEPCESVIPTFQNVACPSMCCSPIHLAGCQQNNVKTEFCSPPVDPLVLSPGRRESMSVNACSPHSCRHTPSPITPSASGMLGLSTEAYRLLAEQDKQLKLLQSQIQRLLEAQATHSESKTNSSKLKQTESEPTRSKSVSIAVGTGASLFWNPPCPLKDDSEDRQEDSAFCNQFMIPGNTEDISQNTITSSLKEIDMYSFTESTRQTEQENHSSSLHSSHKRNEPSDPLPTEQNGVTKSESIIHQDEHTESSNPTEISNHISSVPPEKFYKDLLVGIHIQFGCSSH
ncbi:hypothetical protein GDO86_007866 [Hymenochirus boettgeri]|uniref:SCL-interrupting locus protein n=1 Tax=Hymenochirus boettgeri TaxID=247094 RepID=A0A8T2J0M7_9PIPI|nr:hypothetical protein GDO86_007866 [Hymenochirus boettgeri]